MASEYADELESRAMQHDSEDPGCANCNGHPASFHVNWRTGEPQPCDYITNMEDAEIRNPSEDTLCGCQQFVHKQ